MLSRQVLVDLVVPSIEGGVRRLISLWLRSRCEILTKFNIYRASRQENHLGKPPIHVVRLRCLLMGQNRGSEMLYKISPDLYQVHQVPATNLSVTFIERLRWLRLISYEELYKNEHAA